MSRVIFDADAKHLPSIAFALGETATRALVELAKLKGNGPWLDKMREDLELSMKNTVFTGTPMSYEPAAVEAAIGAIRYIFDRISWGGKPAATGPK